MILFSISSFALADPHHHHSDLTKKVSDVVKLTEKKIEVIPELCPSPEDRAFVNFDKDHMNDPEGFHGMLFFGQGETFYISHLPMFHPPHDYQAIVEVRLSPEAKARYQAELAKKGGYFTFAPKDNFVLPKKLMGKGVIPGSLVQGHFERGGKNLLNTDLEIVRVVYYKKISEKAVKPPKEKYVIFGKGDEYFIAHEIFQRPNVDEIIPLPKKHPLGKKLKADIAKHGMAWVDNLDIKDRKVQIRKDQEATSFPYEEFYRETGDLN